MSGNLDLVAFGNPLLDISTSDNGEVLLKKYDLKANDAILAEDKHMPIYDDIVANHKVTYVAGGAAQNTARFAAYVLPAGSTAYIGCVGKDDFADQLRSANERESVKSLYQVKAEHPTGSCAVVVTGHDRSLCTRLGASEKFDKSHLETPDVKAVTTKAKFFYMGGFFLTHGIESATVLAKQAKDQGVPFSLNFSAPFIPQFFTQQLDAVLPYASYVFGNETEAAAYAEAKKLGTTDLGEIAVHVANQPSEVSIPRIVIFSSGPDPTVYAKQGDKTAKSLPTPKIDDIVDTNGAGDAFAGGVIGALLLGKDIEGAIAVGQRLGGMCIGQVGPVLKYPKEKVL